MTRFEKFKSMTIDELADYIDQHYAEEEADEWFSIHYCNECESVTVDDSDFNCSTECAPCEKTGHCVILDRNTNNLGSTKLWLEAEV